MTKKHKYVNPATRPVSGFTYKTQVLVSLIVFCDEEILVFHTVEDVKKFIAGHSSEMIY